MLLEQVIDVPKITSQDVIPQRAVLRVPQMAEQLVAEPTPSFEVFEVEEEEEQPSVVPSSYFMDAAGRSWCLVDGPAGVYWWVMGTTSGPLRRGTPPGQGGTQVLAAVGILVGDVPVTLQRQIPAVLRVLRASGPVPRQNGGHSS